MSELNLENILANSGLKVFKPVQATESALKKYDPVDGHVYFTTDSKKIYLGTPTDYLSMGGNSGIYYGRKNIAPDNSGQTPDPNVSFVYPVDIEGDTVPMKDDLILNMDGCFYRVQTVVDNRIDTTRLTLQGTGVGGGGGGGGSSIAEFYLNTTGGSTKYFSVSAKTAKIGFTGYSSDATDYIAKYEVFLGNSVSNGTIIVQRENLTWSMGKANYIDLAGYLNNFNEYGKDIVLRITNKYGIPRELPYKIYTVDLQISSTNDKLFSVLDDSFKYTCTISGGTQLASGDTKTVNYELYTEDNLNIPVLTDTQQLSTNQNDATKQINITNLAHGIYVMKVYVSAFINSSGETLTSNVLTYKVLRYQETIGQPLFSVLIPDVVEQYTETPITFLLANAEGSAKYILDIYLDNKKETSLEITANSLLVYNLLFELQGNYSFNVRIPDLGVEFKDFITVSKYTGELPVIKTDDDALIMYLTPQKKTNDATDRNRWSNYSDKYKDYYGTLTDFYYGNINGWTTDKDGIRCLKLTQGAKLTTNYSPFTKDPMNSTTTSGLTIELDFMISGVLNYEENLIECITKNRDNTIVGGFTVTGDEAKFYTNNIKGDEAITFNIVEGKRMRITYVVESKKSQEFPLIYTYLNGIISGATKYDASDYLSNNEKPAYFSVDSTYGQVYLYGFRVYEAALGDITILNNYQASLPLAEREASYKDNLILDSNNRVSLSAILDNPNYKLDIPLVKITGGYSCSKKFEMAEQNPNNKYQLPTGKKDYRLIDFEILYPDNHLFKNYENFSEICVFEDSGLDVTNGFGKTPISGAMMYAQGTSSMEYPVKNLRIKFKSQKFKVRPDLEAVELVCFKADFMESSGSHNTGAANFVDDLYAATTSVTGSGEMIKSPAQKHFTDKKIVTCIKGHPCVVFYNPGVDENGNILSKEDNNNYTYIGKYNLNLDKATPEPFGFRHEDGYGLDENGKSLIHCFEFLDNTIKVCNFQPKEGLSYYDTWHNEFEDYDDDGNLIGKHFGWTEGFESRYPEYEDEEITADLIDHYYTMCAWVNELWALKQTGEAGRKLANERFAAEYKCHFDPDFLLSYYVITTILQMTDNRVKNCMIASWGKKKVTYTDITTGEEKESENFIWCPIFYDMDTLLGLDNTGHIYYDYFEDDSAADVYNGNDVLWDFVRDALSLEVIKMYNNMESSNGNLLVPSTLLSYFNDNQADMANEAFYNGDAKYKYIDTFRSGYKDLLNNKDIAPGEGPRLYAAQGNRSLMREYFINNRLNYLRGKYGTNGFRGGDRLEFRRYSSESDDQRELASFAAVAPDNVYHFTGLKPGFAGVISGGNGTLQKLRTDVDSYGTVETEGETGNTETYLVGISNLSDVGDLSNKYLGVFIVGSEDIRLKRLILGNSHKDYYNKRWIKQTETGDIALTNFKHLEELNMVNCEGYAKGLNLKTCEQIKKVLAVGSHANSLALPTGGILQELRIPTTINVLDIHSHKELEADKFTIGHYQYNNDHYIGGDYAVTADTERVLDKTYYVAHGKGIYEEYNGSDFTTETIYERVPATGYYVNDYSHLTKVSIIDTPIDTYAMACGATNLTDYCFQNVNWVITENNIQYAKTFDVERNASKVYYTYNSSTKDYDIYSGNDFINTTVYEKFELVNADGVITNIPILEYLNPVEQVIKVNENNEVRIRRRSPYNTIEKEALTGTLTINVKDASVSEYDIYQKYHSIYPNLEILYGEDVGVDTAYTINFFNQEAIMENSIPYYTVLGTKDMTMAYLTSKEGPTGQKLNDPSKLAINDTIYEFSGFWRDAETNTLYSQADFETLKPTKDMNFTATFVDLPREYTIRFYSYNRDLLLEDTLTYGTNIQEGLERNYKYIRTEDTQRDAQKTYYIWGAGTGKFTTYSDNDFTSKAIFEKVNRVINPIPFFIPREDNSLDENSRWGLKGWISEKDFIDNNEDPAFYNMDTQVAQANFSAYAYMSVENVLTTPSNLNLFNFATVDGKREISLKPAYRNILSGKVTLPLKDKEGNLIEAIAESGFALIDKITHIYFQEDDNFASKYEIIKDKAFYNYAIGTGVQNSALTFVGLPDSIKNIRQEAFYAQRNLKDINLPDGIVEIGYQAFHASTESGNMQLRISKLPASLVELGSGAFYKGGDNLTISSIPNGVKTLSGNTFAFCPKVAISNFGSRDGGGLTSIGNYDFYAAGTNATPIETVQFYDSVSEVQIATAFDGDSYLSKAKKIVIYNNNLWNATQADNNSDGAIDGIQGVPINTLEFVGG